MNQNLISVITSVSAAFLKKEVRIGDQKFGRRGGVSYVNARKKVPALCPSEKKLLEWRSSVFCHKYTPDFSAETQYQI
jgi:hypothetical protein